MLCKRELGVAHRLMVVNNQFVGRLACLLNQTGRQAVTCEVEAFRIHKLKALSFDDALQSPTPEVKKARERVDAKKRRNKKPEEGKEEKKKEAFVIRQSFDNIGRELISLVSTTLREIGKQDIEAPTKADNDNVMLLPLARKMSKVFDGCETKVVRTELVEGLSNTYGFDMATKEALDCYLVRMLYYMTLF